MEGKEATEAEEGGRARPAGSAPEAPADLGREGPPGLQRLDREAALQPVVSLQESEVGTPEDSPGALVAFVG